MTLHLGSRNPHKLREVRQILGPCGVEISGLSDVSEAPETGDTFAENASQKALFYADAVQGPVLADDSGLVVPALEGEPGVRSARYAGEGASDAENLALLLRRIEERGLAEPEAYFECALALAVPGRVLCALSARVHGRIVAAPRGRGGFGYDPVFFHPESGGTFAELPPERKNALSHRGQALRELARRLPEFSNHL